MSVWQKIRNTLRPGQILVLGFALVILLGTVLLLLPCASTGKPLTVLQALFTATSAVCVTGLTVVNTGLALTVFGKMVLLLLIQVGGLGFMTVASLIFLVLGKRISLRERLVIQESFNMDSLHGLMKLVRSAMVVTAVCELSGALLLALRFVPRYGMSRGLFHSVFTAVSAFCNAGFDLFGKEDSIGLLADDPLVLIVIMLLITLGGIGFAVILDVLRFRRGRRLMLHTRLVLISSAVLLVGGALLTAAFEWNNPLTLGRPGWESGQKLLNALFQSVTLRTAGFDTIGQGGLTPAGTLSGIVFMFIGASPASTGGGAKTTTVLLVLVSVWTIVRRRQDYTVLKKRMSTALVRKALAVFTLMLLLLLVATLAICGIEQICGESRTLSQVLFETVSAMDTVGLTTGITAGLHLPSLLILILLMFFGRLGPLSMSMALSGDDRINAIHYPEDRVMVG